MGGCGGGDSFGIETGDPFSQPSNPDDLAVVKAAGERIIAEGRLVVAAECRAG